MAPRPHVPVGRHRGGGRRGGDLRRLARRAFGVALGIAGDGLGVDPDTVAAMVGPVLVAPLVEEPCKALFLAYVIWNRHFDNMTDGFVYGAAAGLGFGMTENLLYFVSACGDLGGVGRPSSSARSTAR